MNSEWFVQWIDPIFLSVTMEEIAGILAVLAIMAAALIGIAL